MKRMLLRLAALSIVVVLGLIAIAQAQLPQPDDVRLSQDPRDAQQPAAPRQDPFSLGQRPGSRFSAPAAPATPPSDIAPPRRLFDAEPNDSDAIRPPTTDTRALGPDLGAPAALNADDFSARPMGTGQRPRSPTAGAAAPRRLPAAAAAESTPDASADTDPPGTFSVLRRRVHADDGAASSAQQPDRADAASATTAYSAGRPGPRELEGAQTPRLTIEKIAPTESQVGRPARFAIKVTTVGQVTAQGVEIHDCVPQGAQFVAANPAITPGANGELVWQVGVLRPGEQSVVQIDVTPSTEGELGSVATVSFSAGASARTVVTRPQLALEIGAPKQVLMGDNVKLSIKVSNPGTGVASGVVIAERVPAGLQHPAGAEVEYEIGSLKPGETRQVELVMKAAQAGKVVNALYAHAEGDLKAEQRTELDIVAPALAVAMTGPAKRYLERQAVYTVSVSNPGTAPAKDVQLVTQLPRGMKFVKANNSGHYDPATNTVAWSLEELPATETGSVTLVAVPVEPGEQKVRVMGRAQSGLADEKEQTVVVEGLAAVEFDIRAVDEAIETGGETTYVIRVVNTGSKAATGVQVNVLLPAELKATAAEGASRGAVADHQVQFESLAHLAPKGDATFRVRAKALQPGDLRVKAQLLTDDMRAPLTKEESTRVYADQ